MTDETKQALERAAKQTQLSLQQLMDTLAELLPLVAAKQTRYKVSDLPDHRTVRYYISQGLVPKPDNYAGGRANYSGEHILKLLLIKKWQAQHLSLRQIKQRLESDQYQFRRDARAYVQHLVWCLLQDTQDEAINPVKRKRVPQRLAPALDQVAETPPGYLKKTASVKYNIGAECSVYLSERLLQDKSLVKQTAQALRQLAEELEAKG